MPITIKVQAPSLDFTTRARVKLAMNVTDTGEDNWFDQMIPIASDAVRDHTNRDFVRVNVLESVAGNGATRLMVERTPLRSITNIVQNGSTIDSTGYEIDNEKAGIIYRKAGWPLGDQIHTWLTPRIVPNTAPPDFVINYIGGYFVVGDNVTTDMVSAATSTTTSTGDQSFIGSTGGEFSFANRMVANDVITLSGFNVTANNKRMTVVTASSTKITFRETLTAEAASTSSGNRTMGIETLPGSVERGTHEIIKAWFHARERDPAIRREQIDGYWRADYMRVGISEQAEMDLRRWVRIA